MSNPELGGCVPDGLEALKNFKRLKIGSMALINLPDDREEALAVARFCRENGISVIVSELFRRGGHETRWHAPSLTKEDVEAFAREAGPYFRGRYASAESGGILYWPKAYTIGRRVANYMNMPPCSTMPDAHHAYINYIGAFLDYERKQVGNCKIIGEDGSIQFPHIAELDVDEISLEFLPGNPYLLVPSCRGTARAYGIPWGVHVAMGWYGGIRVDKLWLKRWKICIYEAFMSGSEYICEESGHYALFPREQKDKYEFKSEQMKASRAAMREFNRFLHLHTRPGNGPEAPVGVVFGNHDGTPGLWNRYAWGQYESGDQWKESSAEKSWNLIQHFFRRDNPYNEYFQGDESFSGNPPLGKFDILPVNADQEQWNRYSTLIFLGYNLMTDEIHARAVEFVRQGGKLLMWLPHCNVDPVRGAPVKLYRGGDLSELFGVRIEGAEPEDVWGYKYITGTRIPNWEIPVRSANRDPSLLGNIIPAKVTVTSENASVLAGFSDYVRETRELLLTRPALVEHRLGKGFAWLVNAFNYPGDDGMSLFAEHVLRIALRGEQRSIRLLAADSVRYAVYDGPKFKTIYILNTEFDLPQSVMLWLDGVRSPLISVLPAEMNLCYLADTLLIAPEQHGCKLVCNEDHSLTLHGADAQKVILANLGNTALSFVFNGEEYTLEENENLSVECRGSSGLVPDDFLEEPEDIAVDDTKLPY